MDLRIGTVSHTLLHIRMQQVPYLPFLRLPLLIHDEQGTVEDERNKSREREDDDDD